MQIQIGETYNMTLFQIPRIAINSFQESQRLLDNEIDNSLTYTGLKVESLENFSAHSEIKKAFESLSLDALRDALKFYIAQQGLPEKKRNQAKLGIMSHLILSRLMPTINSFYQDEKTKVHGTEFNWNVILGQIQPVASTQATLHSSHSVNMHSIKCDILFYHKLIAHLTVGGRPKKVECIIYCQRFKEPPLGIEHLIDSLKDLNWWSLDTLQYIYFAFLIVFFLFTNRACSGVKVKPEDTIPFEGETAPRSNRTIFEEVCHYRDYYLLNLGVGFLVFIACKTFLYRIQKKMVQEQNKARQEAAAQKKAKLDKKKK